MKIENISVIFLHEHPEYVELSAKLLNKQWKRSLSARVQSLEKSYKDLPDSLLLLEESDDAWKVIGHSRLTRVLEDVNGCWIGSVVIDEERRGKGYGKYIMEKSEEYARQLNFSCVYLNTQDQQGFYEHLGYSYGEAVSSINFKSTVSLRSLTSMCENCCANESKADKNYKENTLNYNQTTNTSVPPSPPALPPISKSVNNVGIKSNIGQYWMKKPL